MIRLVGADLVLPGGVLPSATLVIRGDRIAAIEAGPSAKGPSARSLDGHLIVPGFIDVHVHGVAGIDTLGEGDAVARIAAALPRFGVTAFCPTTVACSPGALGRVLAQVRRARETPAALAARVLPAHLESNFVNHDYRGAQPLECLRRCDDLAVGPATCAPEDDAGFETAELLAEIDRGARDICIVTLAPEIEGGLALVEWLVARGIRVSLGHSGANYDQAQAAIAAGASQATHLFNRMAPLDHRRPGLAGAVLENAAVAAELICDGTHVHPALVRATVAAKGAARIMAITDGTAASALPAGARARLGGRAIVAHEDCARLDDGTMAGSVLTMDGAFRMLRATGFSPSEAAVMCATTPARELRLLDTGAIETGCVADLAVLDRNGQVTQTWVGGRLVYERA